ARTVAASRTGSAGPPPSWTAPPHCWSDWPATPRSPPATRSRSPTCSTFRPTRSSMSTDPDVLFPSDPTQRAIARELFAAAKDLPLICPHGHVDPAILAEDRPFPDPARLFI